MSACLTLRFLCALWCTLRVVLCTLYSIITIEAGLKLRLKGRCVSDVCTLFNVYDCVLNFHGIRVPTEDCAATTLFSTDPWPLPVDLPVELSTGTVYSITKYNDMRHAVQCVPGLRHAGVFSARIMKGPCMRHPRSRDPCSISRHVRKAALVLARCQRGPPVCSRHQW